MQQELQHSSQEKKRRGMQSVGRNEAYITIGVCAWSITRPLSFIAHFLPYRIELPELCLILVTMLFVSVRHAVYPGEGPVQL